MSCGLASALQATSFRKRAPVIVARTTSRASSTLQPSNRMVVSNAITSSSSSTFSLGCVATPVCLIELMTMQIVSPNATAHIPRCTKAIRMPLCLANTLGHQLRCWSTGRRHGHRTYLLRRRIRSCISPVRPFWSEERCRSLLAQHRKYLDQQVFAEATFSIKISNFRLSRSCMQWTAPLCDGLHVCIFQSVISKNS